MQDNAPDDPVCDRDIVQMAHAETDPAFAWTYAAAFAACKEPLPAAVAETAIREAHEYLVSSRCGDSLRGALVLGAAPMKLKCGLLEALLLVSPALSLERIGELTCLPVAVVQIYEALFFSVRDRADDASFLANIAYQNTRAVEFQKDYLKNVDPCDLLKRAAVRGGDDVVLELIGVLASGSSLTDKELARIMKTNILAEAAWLAEAGLVHQPLEIFKLASKLIIADAKAAARAPAPRGSVGATSAATISPAPEVSVLEAAKAVLSDGKAKTRIPKLHHNKIGAEASSSSSASFCSRRSSRSFQRQIPEPIFQRCATIRVGALDTMIFAKSQPFPDRNGRALVKTSFRKTDRPPRLAEFPVAAE
jgi:hypothetical protein